MAASSEQERRRQPLNINDLGDGVLSEIFGYLNAAQVQVRVCHRWRAVTLRMIGADKWYYHWDDRYTDILWPEPAVASTIELVAAALDPRTQLAGLRKMVKDRNHVDRDCELSLALRACISANVSMERLIYVLDGMCERYRHKEVRHKHVCSDMSLFTMRWQDRDAIIARDSGDYNLTTAEFIGIITTRVYYAISGGVKQYVVDLISRASPAAQQVAAVFLVSFYRANQIWVNAIFEVHPTLAEHHGWRDLRAAESFIYDFRRFLLPGGSKSGKSRIDLIEKHYAAVKAARQRE